MLTISNWIKFFNIFYKQAMGKKKNEEVSDIDIYSSDPQTPRPRIED